MRCLILIFFFLISSLLIRNAYAAVVIENPSCPDSLDVGEQGDVKFTIRNMSPDDIRITSLSVTPNEFSNDPNKTLSQFVPKPDHFPSGTFSLQSYSSKDLEGLFSSLQERTFHLDLIVRYENKNGYEQQLMPGRNQICKIQVLSLKSRSATYTNTIVNLLVFPGAIAAVGGFLTWFFNWMKDRSSRKYDYQHWLTQQRQGFYLESYIPLIRSSETLGNYLLMLYKSEEELDVIKRAYLKLTNFMAILNEFESSKKGLYFFVNPDEENIAKGSLNAIRTHLPFEPIFLDSITHKNKVQKIDEIRDDLEPFRQFKAWIKSSHCTRSKSVVINNLFNYADILEWQGYKIYPKGTSTRKPNQPFQEKVILSNKFVPIGPDDNFYLVSLNKKIVYAGDIILLRGFGFAKGTDSFSLLIKEKDTIILKTTELRTNSKIDNEFIKVEIPASLEEGAYDIYGLLNTPLEKKYTIEGLVIQVRKKDTEQMPASIPLPETSAASWDATISGKIEISHKT